MLVKEIATASTATTFSDICRLLGVPEKDLVTAIRLSQEKSIDRVFLEGNVHWLQEHFISYRIPLSIRKIRVFRETLTKTSYYVCPRCDCSLEREFVLFCARCGQQLDWRNYRQVTRVYPTKEDTIAE